MQRVRARDQPELPQRGGDLFTGQLVPVDVRSTREASLLASHVEHLRADVDGGDPLEAIVQRERDLPRAAADIEQPPGAIEGERASDGVVDRLRDTRSVAGVVAGGAREDVVGVHAAIIGELGG